MTRDPLSERVHLSMPAVAGLTLARHCRRRVPAARPAAAATTQKPRGA